MKHYLIRVPVIEEAAFQQYITDEGITGRKVKTKAPGWFQLILSSEQFCIMKLKFNPLIQYVK